MTYSEALAFVDGKEYKLDGVHGTIKVDQSDPLRLNVTHVPSKKGQRTKAYQQTRRALRDDYVTDLTWSERLPEIMIALGVNF